MNRDPEQIEKLLREKKFSELTPRERESVLAFVSGEEEYEHMQKTLKRVQDTLKAEASQLGADADIKEAVLRRFEQNRRNHSSAGSPAEKILLEFRVNPTVRFAGALALLLLVVTASVVFWPEPHPEMAQEINPGTRENTTLPAARDFTATEEEKTLGGKAFIPPAGSPAKIQVRESSAESMVTVAEEKSTGAEDIPLPAAPAAASADFTATDGDRLTVDLEKSVRKEPNAVRYGKTERSAEESGSGNQAPGKSIIIYQNKAENPEKFGAYWFSSEHGRSDAARMEATQREIATFLSRKAISENKPDFLEKHGGKTVELTLYFHPDGKVKQAKVKGAADADSENLILLWTGEMPPFLLSGNADDKNRKVVYLISF